MSLPKCVVFESEDWSALYIDGKLDRVGDGYLADERIRELYGVTTIQSEDYFLGNPVQSRENVAKTLEEIQAYQERCHAASASAAELRAQAEELVAQADELERRARIAERV